MSTEQERHQGQSSQPTLACPSCASSAPAGASEYFCRACGFFVTTDRLARGSYRRASHFMKQAWRLVLQALPLGLGALLLGVSWLAVEKPSGITAACSNYAPLLFLGGVVLILLGLILVPKLWTRKVGALALEGKDITWEANRSGLYQSIPWSAVTEVRLGGSDRDRRIVLELGRHGELSIPERVCRDSGSVKRVYPELMEAWKAASGKDRSQQPYRKCKRWSARLPLPLVRCPKCRQDLTRLPWSGRCPSCGFEYLESDRIKRSNWGLAMVAVVLVGPPIIFALSYLLWRWVGDPFTAIMRPVLPGNVFVYLGGLGVVALFCGLGSYFKYIGQRDYLLVRDSGVMWTNGWARRREIPWDDVARVERHERKSKGAKKNNELQENPHVRLMTVDGGEIKIPRQFHFFESERVGLYEELRDRLAAYRRRTNPEGDGTS